MSTQKKGRYERTDVRHGGTYVCMEGPAFSTRAESRLYKSWNADVIGMTMMPEAKLAREAEICYASLACITDFDSWKQRGTHEVVTGVCVVAGGVARSGVERSVVRFATMNEEELRWYAATGEPLDKAGGYHVDGKGALFIETVEGSPSNVAGLPVRLLLRLVREAGLDLGFPKA